MATRRLGMSSALTFRLALLIVSRLSSSHDLVRPCSCIISRPDTISICDLQEKFRTAIHNFSSVICTTQKLLSAAEILDIPVFATTQLRDKLGDTCSELKLDKPDGVATRAHVDKSAFSMMMPQITDELVRLGGDKEGSRQCIVVGIEAHICVTQTSLDLLEQGHKVYVLADGVSSCNKEEVPVALARLRAEGAIITTSESMIYEIMGDAKIEEFRKIAGLIKESKDATRDTLQALCKI